jgi:uncharacterized protein (TIGR03435 family)
MIRSLGMRIMPFALLALLAPPAQSQVSPPAPRFDATDVHSSAPALNPFTYASGGFLRGNRYDLRKATLLDLIRIAYQIAPENIAGGPNWLEFDRFDVAGRAPADSSPETLRRMLQALLAERFQLSVHNDTRPMPAYVLALGKSKPKLSEAAGTGDPECRMVGANDDASVIFSCRNTSMASLATRLRISAGDYLKGPVIDDTGLDGAWDFTLRWTPRARPLPDGAPRITVSDAADRDLGLSLTLQEAPTPVLVIDHAEKPTPNAPDVVQKLPSPDRVFEVATVKIDKNPQTLPFRTTRTGLQVPSASLKTVLGYAWDMNTAHTSRRFIGLPKGIDDVNVTIDAHTPKASNLSRLEPTAGDDDLRAMTRALLVERFHIQWHYEDRPMDAYSLVAKNSKSKLKSADPSHRASCEEARTMANDPRDTNPLINTVLSCRNVTLAEFASKLQPFDDNLFVYPPEDATGIEGRFDFDLSFTAGPLAESSEALPNGALPLAEAINRRLGIQLEKRKRSLPAIVVEHMDLVPTEN